MDRSKEQGRSRSGGSDRPVEGSKRWSLSGRLTATVFVVVAATAGMAVALSSVPLPGWMVFLAASGTGLVGGAWLIDRTLRPVRRTISGLSHGIRSFRDQDFSVRLTSRRTDELGELVSLYNRVGELLQQQRLEVRERELLLQTALNRSPAAILLLNSLDRVIYSNPEARNLFLDGARLEGLEYAAIQEGCPEQMRGLLESRSDGIFSVALDDRTETYHVAQRGFLINRRQHTLLLLRRMTHDLDRQEAEIWKKVIRVISHELRNSLAPVSSYVHSVRKMSGDPQYADRTEEVFAAIQERLEHLQRFIEGYARFARLPRPRKEEVDWGEFLTGLAGSPSFEVLGRLPTQPAYFDPSQMHQVVLNLLRNAAEASGGQSEIQIRVKAADSGGTFLQVLDRGPGMDEETMHRALLPFYSTKQTGSGLGLPLCREILEAHGGRIMLQNRDEGGTTVTCWLPD